MVNFQLRIFINAGLTERSLYNRFCIERSPKMVFFGGFWGWVKISGGNPQECDDRRSTLFGDEIVEMR